MSVDRRSGFFGKSGFSKGRRVADAIRLQQWKFITIRGLTITGAGGEAIALMGGNNQNTAIHLERNRLFGNGSGSCNGGITIARGNPGTLIVNNLIYGNGRNGITFIDADGGPHQLIENTIHGNAWSGVNVAREHQVRLANNAITGNGTASGSTGGRFGVTREGSSSPDPAGIQLRNNLLCGNRLGEINGPALDATDSGNLTPSGTEGAGVAASPGCRLTALIYRNAAGPLGDLTYAYDPAGNRTGIGGTFARTLLPDPVASATYDAANRQLTFGGQTLTYDANGNLTSDNSTTYTWDARNRLLALSGPTTASFQYDPLGRRAQKTINANTTRFLYDRLNTILEVTGAGQGAALLTGLSLDEYLTRTDGTGVRALIADALGSSLAATDPAGAAVTAYSYEPFGRSETAGSASMNPFQYTGRENDGPGLYYYRARYYHPGLQRFVSEDPIGFWGGDSNLYAYVRSSPTTLVDPAGLLAFFWHGGISALAAYNSGQSATDSLIFGLNTMLVDRGTQGTTAADANIHAMLGTTDSNGAAVLQTPTEAARRIELIIATGPDYLAAHTVQDKAATDHYLQPWSGFRWDWSTAVHLWHDIVPSLRELENAYQGTRAVLAGRKAQHATAP